MNRTHQTAGALGILAAALLALALLLPVTAASADSRIGEEGFGTGQFSGPRGPAVSQAEGGDIYVTENAQRVDEFDPSKPPAEQFLRAFGWDVNAAAPEAKLQTCTAATGCRPGTEGSAPGQQSFADAIAVDNSCAEHEPPLTGAPCEAFDPSYGDIYLVDQNNYRVEKFALNPTSHEYEFLLMFGGEVDKGPHHPGNLCTAAYLAAGDTCGAGVPGTGPAHFYREEPLTDAGGRKQWSRQGSNSIAVGPDGTVYVGDYGRVQKFEPAGAFAGELRLEDPELQFVTSLAVNLSGDLFERSAIYNFNAGGLLHQVPGVREYSPAGTLLRTFDTEESGSDPTHIALDSSGDLFLSNFGAGGELQFRGYTPAGQLFAELTSSQVEPLANSVAQPAGLAVGDAAGQLYATATKPAGSHIAVMTEPVTGPPSAGELHLSALEPTTATLHALVNPRGFDTKYRFQWITQKNYEEDGNAFGAGAEEKPSAPGEDIGLIYREDPVEASISPLVPETKYRYRVVATSSAGEVHPEGTFETPPPVSVRGFTTQTVGPELVKLKAQLSPNNGAGTEYTICIGEEAGNYTRCSSGAVHVLGNEFEALTATFEHLQPNHEYHYQLTARNSYGLPVHTADQSFTTEETLAEQDAAEACPNALRREEDNSLALPDCRAYEQVSPAFKNGFAIEGGGDWLAPGGAADAFSSIGAFAGAVQDEVFGVQYVAHRTGSGWVTRAAVGRPAGPGYEPLELYDLSPELDRWAFPEVSALSTRQARNTISSADYYLGFPDGTFHRASPTLGLVEGEPVPFKALAELHGQSSDLSRLFVQTVSRLLPEPQDPRPSDLHAGSGTTRIYVDSGADGPSPTLELAAELPLGLSPTSGCSIDEVVFSYANSWNTNAPVTSASGATLLYTAPLEEEAGAPCGDGQPNPIGLFARTGAAPPVQLNVKPASQCHAGHSCATAAATTPAYQGVSPDGSRVWFTTEQPLVDSDTDSTADLYLAKLDPETGQLTELVQASAGAATSSHPVPGRGAGLQGVLRISPDGSHVAFVATGALTAEPNALGEAAAGADNLYVYDAESHQTKFVARLCSGAERSGSVADSACPAGSDDSRLWQLGGNFPLTVHFTPDGGHLLFSSYGRLASSDTDNVQDAYRYDFATGGLTRVSIGRNGNDANGNDDAYPVELQGSGPTPTFAPAMEVAEDFGRSISADGAVVVFETAAPLVSRDTNGAADVYEWSEDGHGSCHQAEGCVSLISPGLDPNGTTGGTVSSSGADITFLTATDAVPADTDGLTDVYDARENGGFPRPAEPAICHGAETCHESGTESSLHSNYTSEETHSGGNGPRPIDCAKGRHRVEKHGQPRCVPNHHKKHRRRHKRVNANRGGAR